VLAWLAEDLSPEVGLSLMSQYVPLDGPPTAAPDRRLTVEEYETALQWVERLGFETVWAQSMPDPGESDHYLPDFSREKPFGFFPADTHAEN
jgi:hypothetical protein